METNELSDGQKLLEELQEQGFLERYGAAMSDWTRRTGKTDWPIFKDAKGIWQWVNRSKRKQIKRRS